MSDWRRMFIASLLSALVSGLVTAAGATLVLSGRVVRLEERVEAVREAVQELRVEVHELQRAPFTPHSSLIVPGPADPRTIGLGCTTPPVQGGQRASSHRAGMRCRHTA